MTSFRPAQRRGIQLLFREIRPVRGLATATTAVLLASVAAILVGPLLVREFVDLATEGAEPRALVVVALGYLGIAMLGGGTRVAASYLGVQCGWRIADSLRMRLLRRAVVDSPVLDVERRAIGEVLEEVEGNADIVGRSIAVSGFPLLANVALTAGTLGVLTVAVPGAGLGILVLLVGVCILLSRLSRVAVRRWERARNHQADLFGFVGDALGARDDLLPLGQTPWAVERIGDDLDGLYRTQARAYIAGRAIWPLTQLFMAFAFALGFGFGLEGLQQGAISIGTLTLVYLYVDQLQKPLEEMSSQFAQMQQMLAVLGLAARTLDADDHPAPDARPTGLDEGPLSVVFEDVTFSYGDTPVLQDVSFEIAPGRALGVVGRTGAGKSTIVNLLCGLARPQRGRVLLGGVDASLLDEADIARRVTVMSQRAHVFTASVRDNITLFDESLNDTQVWDVLRRLGSTEWVRALPDGLDTVVGSGGRALSEGELQVLSGARALIRPARLLIVDEGTSRLDPRTEEAWARLLRTVMSGRTVLVVDHRQKSLEHVDHVLVMAAGRVVELRPVTPLFSDATEAVS